MVLLEDRWQHITGLLAFLLFLLSVMFSALSSLSCSVGLSASSPRAPSEIQGC